MKRKEESGELRKVAVGLRREKNLEKNLGGSPGRPFGENGDKRREKWKEWGTR